MNQTPLVSIIAVCYNHADYVVSCLESIHQQSWPEVQVIFCDDHSSDESASIATDWLQANIPDAHTIIHTENKGLCATLNEAVALTQGKYLQFISCDDILLPDSIACRLKLLVEEAPEVVMCCGNFAEIDDSGALLTPSYYPFNYHLPQDMLAAIVTRKMVFHPLTALWRKSILLEVGGFDESFAAEGFHTWLKIFSMDVGAIFCSDSVALYRRHELSFSQSGAHDIRFGHDRLRALRELSAVAGLKKIVSERIKGEVFELLRLYLEFDQVTEAQETLREYLGDSEEAAIVCPNIFSISNKNPSFMALAMRDYRLSSGVDLADFFLKRELPSIGLVIVSLRRFFPRFLGFAKAKFKSYTQRCANAMVSVR